MAHVEESLLIQAPIEQLFDIIADHRQALTWLDGFSRFDHVAGPECGVGARVRTEGRMMGFLVATELEVVSFEPPFRLDSRSTNPIRSETAWTLRHEGRSVLVSFIGDYHLPLAMRLVGDRAIEERVSGQIRRSLANLKALVEPPG